MSAELTKSEQAAIKRVQADQAAFEVWCKTEGLPVTPAKEMECWDKRFPATYWTPNTETAWRAWANKPAPEQGALTDALPKWIDDQKGKDPIMDDMIYFIEQRIMGQVSDALPLVFGMSGKNMTFTIGVQKFTLMYTPDDSQEFEFMSAMLTKAIAQVKGQVSDMSLRSDAADAARLDHVYKLSCVYPFIAPIATKEAWLVTVDKSMVDKAMQAQSVNK